MMPDPFVTISEERLNAELAQARDYFDQYRLAHSEHHGAIKWSRKDSGLSASYLDVNGRLLRLANEKEDSANYFGKGGFGSVKHFQNEGEQDTYPVKVQKLATQSEVNNFQREAAMNIDLDVAMHEAFYIRGPKGIKGYQEMENLGTPLHKKIHELTDDERLDYSIKLLLSVNELHAGDASRTHTPYVHCDIKPDNILIDDDGELRLIDFGLATSDMSQRFVKVGSDVYRAFDSGVPIQVNGMTADRLASLKTIFHPSLSDRKTDKNEPVSIYDTVSFSRLPQCIQTLIDTSDDRACINNLARNEAAIAAVLIYYKTHPEVTGSDVDAIINDPKLQAKLLATQKIVSPTITATMNALIDGAIYMWKILPTLRSFVPTYLSNFSGKVRPVESSTDLSPTQTYKSEVSSLRGTAVKQVEPNASAKLDKGALQR